MIFDSIIHEVTLRKRYKRFFAEFEFSDGKVETAHCPNTGSMKTCFDENSKILVSESRNPNRKLKWTWEFSKVPTGLIGVNTSLPNKIVLEALHQRKIPALQGFNIIRSEVKYGSLNSRIDILLEDPGQCFVEVKNVTYFDPVRNCTLFPDAVTERGQKHLLELMGEVKKGNRAVIFFVINRPEGDFFCPADNVDIKYATLLRQAHREGVEVMAWRVKSTIEDIVIDHQVEVVL